MAINRKQHLQMLKKKSVRLSNYNPSLLSYLKDITLLWDFARGASLTKTTAEPHYSTPHPPVLGAF